MSRKIYLSFFFLLLTFNLALAQNGPSPDDLFKQAHTVAFDQKNYPLAISLMKQAIVKSPDYSDLHVFLGRLYTWSDKLDSARAQFILVLNKHPEYEDASFAYGSLEYWNHNPEKALSLIESGLKYHAKSNDLLFLKARVLHDLRRDREANIILVELVKTDPKNAAVHAFADKISDKSASNKIGISYDYIYFDKQFNTPWHLAEIDYTRQTGLGPVSGILNYANRFNSNGLQYEVDAYPHISRVFYAYVSGAYSGNEGVFPKYRSGFSLYANLPKSFEGELGFRYLYFTGSTWLYTASFGKYYKDFRFNVRTYLTPSNNTISQSYALDIRYYTGGTDDYLSLSLGTGVSPDDPRNIILLNNGNNYKLRSNNISAGYRHTIRNDIVFINASLSNQEYQFQTHGNQLDIGIGYQKRF
ncbi:MAG TPA: YaiO family outer membrane beta-barrel protein [Mucilaginibacter sp.]|jgi:YaiO family outer membrane protein|nr:YaiO family outer membrane beta-barrel protein [Mucilaginibacter sp.]